MRIFYKKSPTEGVLYSEAIKNDSYLRENMERKFKECIEFSIKINNISGAAITESLLAHFYFYTDQYKLALDYNKKSYDKNVLIKDYKGIDKSLRFRIKFLEEAKQSDINKDDLEKSLQKSREELKLLWEHNPGLYSERGENKY